MAKKAIADIDLLPELKNMGDMDAPKKCYADVNILRQKEFR